MSPPLTATRPSFVVAGVPRPDLAAALLSLSIDDRLAGACRLHGTFTNWASTPSGTGLPFDQTFTGTNRAIQVSKGDVVIFAGEIAAVEAIFAKDRPPAIAVIASGSPRDFREKNKTRRFTAISDGDLFKLLAQEHGLTPDLRLLRTRTSDIAQVNETDFALVVRRAREIGAETWLHDKTLHVVDRASRPSPTITLTHGAALVEFTGTMAPAASGWTDGSPKRGAGVAADTPLLQGGGRVAAQGVGEAFSGAYYVTRVEHLFDVTLGFRSAFDAERLWPQPT